eukprot:gene3724-4293_t
MAMLAHYSLCHHIVDVDLPREFKELTFASVSVEVNNVLEEVFKSQGFTITGCSELLELHVFPEDERDNRVKELRANVDGTELQITEAEAAIIGTLFTLPSHRGRGQAKRVVSDLLLRIFTRYDTMPYTFIRDDNVPSQTLFRGIGFKPITYVKWLMVSLE